MFKFVHVSRRVGLALPSICGAAGQALPYGIRALIPAGTALGPKSSALSLSSRGIDRAVDGDREGR